MLRLVKTDQECIDLLFENPADERQRPVYDKIAAIASLGLQSPGALSHGEIQKVCYALIVHFSQMGIGVGLVAR